MHKTCCKKIYVHNKSGNWIYVYKKRGNRSMHSKSSRSNEAFFNWRRSASPVWLNNYISHRIIDVIIYPCPIISWYLFVNEILCKSVFLCGYDQMLLDKIWINTASGNGVLPDGSKPLHEPMLTYYQYNFVALPKVTFYMKKLNREMSLNNTLLEYLPHPAEVSESMIQRCVQI